MVLACIKGRGVGSAFRPLRATRRQRCIQPDHKPLLQLPQFSRRNTHAAGGGHNQPECQAEIRREYGGLKASRNPASPSVLKHVWRSVAPRACSSENPQLSARHEAIAQSVGQGAGVESARSCLGDPSCRPNKLLMAAKDATLRACGEVCADGLRPKAVAMGWDRKQT